MKVILLVCCNFFIVTANASNFSQFFNSNSGSSSTGKFIFTRDSTWTVPTGVTKINVQITGAGGGAPGSVSSYSAGGGGGGSCIKNGATVLSSANGGRGGGNGETQGQPGFVTSTTLTVTPGDTLSIYVGGGGGAGGYNGGNSMGGSGGYGFCGSGGAGGAIAGTVGGTGGANLGGGGGAAYSAGAAHDGGNAASSTGGTGYGGGAGGTALVGGVATSFGSGGGASGGAGGTGGHYDGVNYNYATSGLYATNAQSYGGSTYNSTATTIPLCAGFSRLNAGEPGIRLVCMNIMSVTIGGAGGQVTISW